MVATSPETTRLEADAEFVWWPHAKDQTRYPAPEAFLCILALAATCDQGMGQLESALLQFVTRRWSRRHVLREQDIEALNYAVVARLGGGSGAALDAACAVLPREMGPAAFAYALDIMLCDGEMSANEADFAAALRSKLEIDAGLADRITDVATLKHRY